MSNPTLPDLIAHYLATEYPSVLEPFLSASGTRRPDGPPPQPDLRTLVEDYISYSLAARVGDMAIDQADEKSSDGSWRGCSLKDMMGVQLPIGVTLGGVKRTIEGVSVVNLLTVGVVEIPERRFDTATASYHAEWKRSIITSSVDKTLKIISYQTGDVDKILEPHKAAVLAFDVHPTNPRYLLSGSMDGSTVLTDLVTDTPLQSFKSTKYVVRVAFSPDGEYFATASYDKHIVIYKATTSALAPIPDEDDIPLDEFDDPNLACDPSLRYTEIHRLTVDSNPEAIIFHPDSKWLLYTLRSSHLLHYLRLDGSDFGSIVTKSFNPSPLDNHQSFAILNLAIHPSKRIIACQTGDHRGGAGERILLYGIEPEETERLACLWTSSEGDDFVLPRMAWLPDGSGLIATTPNGCLNLVSLSGELRSSVKIHGSTEAGQGSSEVVRDCAIVSTSDNGWEVVSVGYDKKVRISR